MCVDSGGKLPFVGEEKGQWVLGTDASSPCLSMKAVTWKDDSQHYRTTFPAKLKQLKRGSVNKQPFEDSGGISGLMRQVSLLPWGLMAHLDCWAPHLSGRLREEGACNQKGAFFK